MEDEFLPEIKEMVEFQETLWGPNVDRRDQTLADWLAVIMEEVGKVAQAVVRVEQNGLTACFSEARYLLLSVIGVCASTIEAMDASERTCEYCDHWDDDPENRTCPCNCPVIKAGEAVTKKMNEKLAGSE